MAETKLVLIGAFIIGLVVGSLLGFIFGQGSIAPVSATVVANCGTTNPLSCTFNPVKGTFDMIVLTEASYPINNGSTGTCSDTLSNIYTVTMNSLAMQMCASAVFFSDGTAVTATFTIANIQHGAGQLIQVKK